MARASGAARRTASGTSVPCGALRTTTCGLVGQEAEGPHRLLLLLGQFRGRRRSGRPPGRRGRASDDLQLLDHRLAVGPRLLESTSSVSTRLVTTLRSAKSSSSRKAARSAAGSRRRSRRGRSPARRPGGSGRAAGGCRRGVPGHQAGGVEQLDRGRGDLLGPCSSARKSSRGSFRVAMPTWPEWTLPGSGVAPVRS